jgi:hypothetical protein
MIYLGTCRGNKIFLSYYCVRGPNAFYISENQHLYKDLEIIEAGKRLARKRGFIVQSGYGYELTHLGKAMMNLTQ